MVYKSPMVLTPESSVGINFTITAPTITAISDGGTFFSNFGEIIKIARQTAPTKSDCQLKVEIASILAVIFSTVSIGLTPAA